MKERVKRVFVFASAIRLDKDTPEHQAIGIFADRTSSVTNVVFARGHCGPAVDPMTVITGLLLSVPQPAIVTNDQRLVDVCSVVDSDDFVSGALWTATRSLGATSRLAHEQGIIDRLQLEDLDDVNLVASANGWISNIDSEAKDKISEAGGTELLQLAAKGVAFVMDNGFERAREIIQ